MQQLAARLQQLMAEAGTMALDAARTMQTGEVPTASQRPSEQVLEGAAATGRKLSRMLAASAEALEGTNAMVSARESSCAAAFGAAEHRCGPRLPCPSQNSQLLVSPYNVRVQPRRGKDELDSGSESDSAARVPLSHFRQLSGALGACS